MKTIMQVHPLQSCIDENDNATDRDVADKFNFFFTTVGKGLQNDVPNVDSFNVEYVLKSPKKFLKS